MNFIENMKNRAKESMKKIVLPEASDIRTITAAATALNEGYAEIVLVGDETSINKMAIENNLDISKATIINPLTSERTKECFKEKYNQICEIILKD